MNFVNFEILLAEIKFNQAKQYIFKYTAPLN